MDTKLLTPTGKKKLEEELDNLKQKRVAVAGKIKDAKELGDLSENAEYHAAKEEQGFIEARINEIVALLKTATIVTPQSSGSKVSIGSKIKFKSANGDIQEYELVGMNEADPSNGRVSANSPIGAACLGAKKGDEIQVNTPGGKMDFTIVEVG